MKRERKFPAGLVTVLLNAKGERIEAIKFYGDFFGNGNLSDLEQALIGEPLTPALEQRLKELDFLVDKDGTVFRIHFSAGIVEVSGGLESLEENEKCADKALYIVKQRGRDGFEWYNNQ